MNRTTPMKRRGKKTLEWDKARAELKKEFMEMGVTTCEFRGRECMHNDGLTFAHRAKRRFITTPAELRRVALLCYVCHQAIEGLGHKPMFDIITFIISHRTDQPVPDLNQ